MQAVAFWQLSARIHICRISFFIANRASVRSTEQQQQLSWAQFDCCVPPEGKRCHNLRAHALVL
jgi:hypothetical protein